METVIVEMTRTVITDDATFGWNNRYKAISVPHNDSYLVEHFNGAKIIVESDAVIEVLKEGAVEASVSKVVAESVKPVLTKNSEDCWGYIAQETGLERHVAKQFLYKFWQGDQTILEIARELKLSAFNIQYILLCFDQWSGAAD